MRESIGKHSGPVIRHSGESRNPEHARHRERSRRTTSLDSGESRNDSIVYQFIHASANGFGVARSPHRGEWRSLMARKAWSVLRPPIPLLLRTQAPEVQGRESNEQ